MDLYTRCPHCDTTFRVTTPQLRVSSGQVRCGFCNQVFDAFATLTARDPSASPAAEPAPAPDLAPAPAAAAVTALPAAETPAVQTKKPPSARSPHKPVVPVRPDPAAGLYEWEFRMPQAPRRTGLWVMLSLLLVGGLAAQAAYAFRTEISVMLPQTRNLYLQACAQLGCTVSLPRLAGFLHIEASDLKTADPARPNEIELMLSMRNRAPVEVDFPAFELTLTNAQDQTIGRRVFLPREYLAGVEAGAGLRAGDELPVRLYLDTGALRAAGYRLYLFYP